MQLKLNVSYWNVRSLQHHYQRKEQFEATTHTRSQQGKENMKMHQNKKIEFIDFALKFK